MVAQFFLCFRWKRNRIVWNFPCHLIVGVLKFLIFSFFSNFSPIFFHLMTHSILMFIVIMPILYRLVHTNIGYYITFKDEKIQKRGWMDFEMNDLSMWVSAYLLCVFCCSLLSNRKKWQRITIMNIWIPVWLVFHSNHIADDSTRRKNPVIMMEFQDLWFHHHHDHITQRNPLIAEYGLSSSQPTSIIVVLQTLIGNLATNGNKFSLHLLMMSM